MLEEKDVGDQVGVRDPTAAFESLMDVPGVSEQDFVTALREAGMSEDEATAIVNGDTDEMSDLPAMVTPVYSEMAHLCGADGYVALFASSRNGSEPALQQYRETEAVRSESLPDGVDAAWVIRDLDNTAGSGFAWRTRELPEVVVVATTLEGKCDLTRLVGEISIERTGK